MTLSAFPNSLTLALVLLCGISMEVANAQPGGGKRGGPPPEAFEACSSKASGDSCQMTGRRGEDLQGLCIIPKQEQEQTLVCAPEGAPGGGDRPDTQGR